MFLQLIRGVAALTLVACVAGCGGGQSTTSTGATTGTHATTGATTTASAPVTTSSTTTTTTSSPSSTTSTTSTSTTSTTRSSSTTPTTHTQTSTSSTTSNCGSDCQPSGTPAVPGSKTPVNGKCPSGYTYLPPQDGGPALCIPQASGATTSTSSTN